jgi:hypothetical protein
VAHLEWLGWICVGLVSPIRSPLVQTGQRTASQVQTRESKLKDITKLMIMVCTTYLKLHREDGVKKQEKCQLLAAKKAAAKMPINNCDFWEIR